MRTEPDNDGASSATNVSEGTAAGVSMTGPDAVKKKRWGEVYRGPVIDCDIHNDWKTQSDLYPYMSSGWQEYANSKAGPEVQIQGDDLLTNLAGGYRDDAEPIEGGIPGSRYELMRDQLLDPLNVRRAVLTHGTALFGVNRIRNPYFAAEVTRAANDWMVDEWLSKDERLFGSILITNHMPDVAAAEIRRLAEHKRMCQVLTCGNAIGQTLGHPIFHPIYEAAAETGLPLGIHGGGRGAGHHPAAGGILNFYLEFHALRSQPVMTDVISLILHGVFDKFPGLKVMIVEGGTLWVPGLLWRLDDDYKPLRREVPWLKRLPSEYFKEFFRLTAQPLESPSDPNDLVNILDSFGGRELVVFASDYPHWDTDEVDYIATRFPREWLPDLFWLNAAKFYGWDSESVSDASAPETTHAY